ncbi:MAG TPA: DUF2249 domain-containing protein [Rariglobus sp.]|jgi:uncharacterized protein (DUF2249 family)|nr:DUF2249 domain-containing protein [Rariglobus sp.]
MTNTPDTMDLSHFDVRVIPCRQKHALIFERWKLLPVGEYFVLINDHDPVPLYYQFAAQFPDAFTWEYLKSGPEEFHVKITRISVSPAAPAITPPTKPVSSGSSVDVEIDARGLEPPEPMTRILAAVENLKPGATLRAHTDRRPLHLHAELQTRGLHFTSQELVDGSCLTTLSRR